MPMSRTQWIAVATPPLLTATMIPTYRLLAHRLGPRRAWYAGFPIYWLWCLAGVLGLVGVPRLRAMLRPLRPQPIDLVMVALPAGLAFAGRGAPPRKALKPAERAALVAVTLVNSPLEELFWRGVPLALFPDAPRWGAVWPALWFALWHLAPGSVAPGTSAGGLAVAAGLYGAALSYQSRRTGAIGWAAISHTLAGLVQALR